MNFKILFYIVIGICSITQLFAQEQTDSDLFIELRKLDSVFFERGFNLCDIKYLEETVADELTFYHDIAGTQNKDEFLKSTRENLCGNMNQKPIRKVRVETLTVFPLHNNGVLYGAIQSGVHDFYIREKDKVDRHTGYAKFTSVWTKKEDVWLLSEVLSFDHKGVE